MTSAITPSQSTAGKTGRNRAIRIVGGALLIGLLLFAGIWPRLGRNREAVAIAKTAETSAPAIFVAPVKAAAANGELLLPGNTEAVNVASIYARANGYVRERMVDIGSLVKAGQTLAVIESPEVDQELAQARAALEQTKAALQQASANLEQSRAGVNQATAVVAQAKANEEIAATTDQRWSRLVERGVIPRQSGDERRSAFLARKAESEASTAALRTSEANVVSRTADFAAARANVDAQSANVRRLEQLQGFQRVLAPFDGVVTERKVERGDLVTAGSASARNLFTVAQPRTLRIQVNVPQSYSVDLHAGQTAEILMRERPGRTYTGKVARTAHALDAGSRTLLTEVQIDNASGELLPGMYAQVKFTIPRSSPAFVIPANSLIADAHGTRVGVVDQAGRVHFRNVQVGRDFGPNVEILSGVQGGESVATNPPDTLVEGQQLAVQHLPEEKKQ